MEFNFKLRKEEGEGYPENEEFDEHGNPKDLTKMFAQFEKGQDPEGFNNKVNEEYTFQNQNYQRSLVWGQVRKYQNFD